MLPELSRIRELRKKSFLTQSEFARKANVSQSLIAKIESGKIDPSYSKVKQILETLEMQSKSNEKEAETIMVKKLIASFKDENVAEIIKKLNKNGISQMPVVDNGKAIGMIYESRILEKSEEGITGLKAEDVMDEVPPILAPDAKLSIVAEVIKQYPAILIARQGKLIGIISKSDVLKAMI